MPYSSDTCHKQPVMEWNMFGNLRIDERERRERVGKTTMRYIRVLYIHDKTITGNLDNRDSHKSHTNNRSFRIRKECLQRCGHSQA
jgi:hypothetical protein